MSLYELVFRFKHIALSSQKVTKNPKLLRKTKMLIADFEYFLNMALEEKIACKIKQRANLMKTILILRASNDICDVEINQIQTVAQMHQMEAIIHIINGPDALIHLADYGKRFDYVYLATHANPEGFGDESYFVYWYEFAQTICPLDIISSNAVFLLACCRGGVRNVSYDIFAGCDKTQFVCGARWKLTAPDLTAGFHAFIYNMEYRRLQPDQAAKRASDATGYDFLCYDRVEIERTKKFKQHQEQIWGIPAFGIDNSGQ